MKFLRRKDAAAYIRTEWGLPCAGQTLAKLAVIGGGPTFRKAGRYPLYRTEDLDLWAQSRIGPPRNSTSPDCAASAENFLQSDSKGAQSDLPDGDHQKQAPQYDQSDCGRRRQMRPVIGTGRRKGKRI
jgi:hypothetical protein